MVDNFLEFLFKPISPAIMYINFALGIFLLIVGIRYLIKNKSKMQNILSTIVLFLGFLAIIVNGIKIFLI